ncbi:MAG: cell division protein ZapA [Blastocatellia bacterium]|nr:cell division protein ZapA [Blastocatellia bacterium]
MKAALIEKNRDLLYETDDLPSQYDSVVNSHQESSVTGQNWLQQVAKTCVEQFHKTAKNAPDTNPSGRCRVDVEIYGSQYQLAADTSAEYLRKLAEDVDIRMKRTADLNPGNGPMRVAILALLGLVSEVEQIAQKLKEQENLIAERCNEIEHDIENLLNVS